MILTIRTEIDGNLGHHVLLAGAAVYRLCVTGMRRLR